MATYLVPLSKSSVNAGFPSPAEDFAETHLDIYKKIVKNPSSTFLVKARGESMIEKGINDGDILVVDKSLEPQNNSIIIAYIDGEFTVKRFFKKKDKIFLFPANKDYNPITVTSKNDFLVWGVVTYVLHQCV
jgi:DNA polymerase V